MFEKLIDRSSIGSISPKDLPTEYNNIENYVEKLELKIKYLDKQLDDLRFETNKLRQENNLLKSKKDIEVHVSCCSTVDFYKEQNDQLNKRCIQLQENHYSLMKFCEEKGLIDKWVLFPTAWKEKKESNDGTKVNG